MGKKLPKLQGVGFCRRSRVICRRLKGVGDLFVIVHWLKFIPSLIFNNFLYLFVVEFPPIWNWQKFPDFGSHVPSPQQFLAHVLPYITLAIVPVTFS